MDAVTETRSYVTLVKARATTAKDGERWIEGYATTPDLDRVGDVVEPLGAQYELPLPLLWMHSHHEPIGSVTEANVSARGIRIKARLATGLAKADEVWGLISDGILNAVSIGFRALESEPMRSGGRRFKRWEFLELSVVSVPACASAKISVAKMMAYSQEGYQKRVTADPEPVAAAPFGYQRGMTQGGIDLERIFSEVSKRAQELGLRELAQKDGSHSKEDLPLITHAIAEFAKLTARKSLAMVADLEERIARIESKGVVYRGHYNASDEYTRGDLVTHAGSIFHATRDTAGIAPTHGGDERKELDHPWQMACRRGRDAK